MAAEQPVIINRRPAGKAPSAHTGSLAHCQPASLNCPRLEAARELLRILCTDFGLGFSFGFGLFIQVAADRLRPWAKFIQAKSGEQ